MDKPIYRILISVIAFLFLLGLVAGALTASRIDTAQDAHLFSFLHGYAQGLQDGTTQGTPFWQALVNAFLFPLLAFLAGFTLLGVVMLPLLLLIRGFMLSFVVTAFVSVFGADGLWLAIGEIGFQCLLSIPCLLILSACSARSALMLIGMTRSGIKPAEPIYTKSTLMRLSICGIAMMVCALADFYIAPLLQNWLVTLVRV